MMDFTKVKGVIFDIDGTLLDSMPIWNELSARYLKSLKVEPEKDLNSVMESMSVKEGCRYLKNHYGLNKSEEEINEGIILLLKDFYFHEVKLKPGVPELLKKIKGLGIPVVAATTGDRILAENALARNGVLEYFKSFLICNELNTNKTEPLIFYKAMEICAEDSQNLDSKDFIVIEDSLTPVVTAKNAGFITVAVEDSASKSNWEKLKDISDFYVKSLMELL